MSVKRDGIIIKHLHNPLIKSIPISQIWQEQWHIFALTKVWSTFINKSSWPETELLTELLYTRSGQLSTPAMYRAFFPQGLNVQKRDCSFSQFSLSLFLQGRVLVCADGATSKLATQLGIVKQPPQGSCSRAYVEGGTHNFKADGVIFYPRDLLPGMSR